MTGSALPRGALAAQAARSEPSFVDKSAAYVMASVRAYGGSGGTSQYGAPGMGGLASTFLKCHRCPERQRVRQRARQRWRGFGPADASTTLVITGTLAGLSIQNSAGGIDTVIIETKDASNDIGTFPVNTAALPALKRA